MVTIKIQPFRALKALFGYGVDKAPLHREPGMGMDAKQFPGLFEDSAWNSFQTQMKIAVDRNQVYNELEEMDQDDIVASAVDLYAEDSTQVDLITGRTVWVNSPNPQVQKLANDLLNLLGMEDKVRPIARNLVVFGDDFEAILNEQREDGTSGPIAGISFVDPYKIHRHADGLGRLLGFSRGEFPDPVLISLPWDYVHFRLLGRRRKSEYGTATINNARRVFRILRMMEDAMVIYRVRRAPDRLVFGIDVGNRSDEDAYELLHKVRQEFRKRMITDPDTGNARSEMNPLGLDEDIYTPLRDGKEMVNIQKLPGTSMRDNVLDIDYMRKRLYGTLRVPGDYLGFSESKGGFLARTTLADQDVNFARGCKVIQRSIMVGVTQMVKMHLAWSGIDPNAVKNEFTTHMVPVSHLDELQKSEHMRVRAETLEALQELGQRLKLDQRVWMNYVWKLSGFPEDVVFPEKKEGSMQGDVEIFESKMKEMTKLLCDKKYLEAVSHLGLSDMYPSAAVPMTYDDLPLTFEEQKKLGVKKITEDVWREKLIPVRESQLKLIGKYVPETTDEPKISNAVRAEQFMERVAKQDGLLLEVEEEE